MNERATDGQIFAVNKLFYDLSKCRPMRTWVISQVIGREIRSTKELLKREWESIRDAAYPEWVEDNWEPSREFMAKVETLKARYEREVIGQLDMFLDLDGGIKI